MATTTAKITVSSSDLLSDVLALDVTATLTDAGTSTGITQTSGLGRTITTSASLVVLYDRNAYTDNGAAKVYIKNASVDNSEYITISLSGAVIGRLYAGDWALMPWDTVGNFEYTPSVATSLTVEHMLFHEG